MILALNVDDTILVSSNLPFMQELKKVLSSTFDMVDLGDIHSCLGIQVQRYRHNGILLLRQTKFIQDIVQKFGLATAHSANTPCITRITKSTSTNIETESLALNQPYANLVGYLQFVGMSTRPDILFVANLLILVLSIYKTLVSS